MRSLLISVRTLLLWTIGKVQPSSETPKMHLFTTDIPIILRCGWNVGGRYVSDGSFPPVDFRPEAGGGAVRSTARVLQSSTESRNTNHTAPKQQKHKLAQAIVAFSNKTRNTKKNFGMVHN